MKNLEQIRAASALKYWAENKENSKGEDGRNVVDKLPTLIINNGLLATVAYAKDKGKEYETLFAEIFSHLCKEEIKAMPKPDGHRPNEGKLDAALGKLTASSSIVLQRATTESLAYLAYLKRFAPKPEKE